MNPSQENFNDKLFSQSNGPFINNQSWPQNNLTFAFQKTQQKEQLLLDDNENNPQSILAKEIFKNQLPLNNSIKNSNVMKEDNDQLEKILAQNKLQSEKNAQNLKLVISRFDEQLQKIMKASSNLPNLSKKKSATNEAQQNEQKNRNFISRLSQQILPKAAGYQAVESAIKSKIKSRQTVGGFGLERGRNRRESNFFVEQQIQKQGQLDLKSVMDNNKSEKMEIEEQANNSNLDPEQIKIKDKENLSHLTNQSNNSLSFTQPNTLTRSAVQGRLSEVKRQRDRLSMGRDNLINFIRTIDEEEKKKEIKIGKQRQRVTIDYFSILKFISEGNENSNEESKEPNQQQKQKIAQQPAQKSLTTLSSVPIKEKPSRRMTQFMKPLQPEKVILEDQKQDDFTPMKTHEKGKNKSTELFQNQKEGLSIFGNLNIKMKQQNERRKTIDYDKFVIDEYLGKIKERVAQQRKIVENLRRQRQQIIAQNAKSLTQFNVTSKNLKQIQIQNQQLNKQIIHLKQRLNPNDYLEYMRIINKFQLNFGIRFHRYDRINKSFNSEGFYVEFTLDNLICRIKRNSMEEPFVIKFQPCLGMKNEDLYLPCFGTQWRTLIYAHFINKKLLKTTHFLSFMVNFNAYIQELNRLELTYDSISNLYELRNPLITEANLTLEFEMVISNKYEFLCKIDLLKLRENEGIEIISLGDNKKLDLPEEVFIWRKGGNKLLSCINFIIEYCHESMTKQVEKQIDNLSK